MTGAAEMGCCTHKSRRPKAAAALALVGGSRPWLDLRGQRRGPVASAPEHRAGHRPGEGHPWGSLFLILINSH